MNTLFKHAQASALYGSDLGPQLSAVDTLTGAPAVAVKKLLEDGTLLDATADFLDPGNPSIVGTVVQFTLKPRIGTSQPRGAYIVLVECGTTLGLRAVNSWELRVTDEGI